MSLIKIQNVIKHFRLGDVIVKALRGVSIEVEKGEFVAIIGPSGSGKSTLMHIIGALDSPSAGNYFLDNEDVSYLSEKKRAEIRNKKIGFVFQTFNLLARYSAVKNVELPLLYSGVSEEERKKRVGELLKKVGLSDRVSHNPSELSGGQKQRVAIARALANKPEIILADEPTGNLDTQTGNAILDILVQLNKKEKVTMIIVTHDPEIAQFADRVITLRDGEVVKDQKKRRRKKRSKKRTK
jgi:putative ABC transport system ATP-binding protein